MGFQSMNRFWIGQLSCASAAIRSVICDLVIPLFENLQINPGYLLQSLNDVLGRQGKEAYAERITV